MELLLDLRHDLIPVAIIPKIAVLSKYFNEYVKQNLNRLVPPPTSHKVRGKETLPDDIDTTLHNRVAFAVKKCAVCRKSYRGSFTRFGVYGHKVCTRRYLINTYYLSKWGLQDDDVCDKIPIDCLIGFRPYYKEQYNYNVIWKMETHPYLINPKYTLVFLMKHDLQVKDKYKLHQRKLQKQKDEEERAARQAEQKIATRDTKRKLALDNRVRKLREWATKEHIYIDALLTTFVGDPSHLYGDYLSDNKMVSKTKMKTVKNRLCILNNFLARVSVGFTNNDVIQDIIYRALRDEKAIDCGLIRTVSAIRNPHILLLQDPEKYSPEALNSLVRFEKVVSDQDLKSLQSVFTEKQWNSLLLHELGQQTQATRLLEMIDVAVQAHDLGISGEVLVTFMQSTQEIIPAVLAQSITRVSEAIKAAKINIKGWVLFKLAHQLIQKKRSVGLLGTYPKCSNRCKNTSSINCDNFKCRQCCRGCTYHHK